MKHKLTSLLALALAALSALSLLAGCGTNNPSGSSAPTQEPGSKTLSVMASFYPVYDFTQKIGGNRVTVTDMVPAGTEPHDWEPSPSDITALEKANVFVYSGAGMEHWADSVLATLENKSLVTVEASQGVSLLAGHGSEEGEEDHGESSAFDPHVWLSPKNAKIEMENIKNALVQADPDGKDYYESNYATWSAECDKLDQEFQDSLSVLPNKDIVVSHEAFGYLCDSYGLTQLGIEGITPDSEPDPARMAEIQDFVTTHHVKVIFSEDLVSPKVAQAIADATGATVETLNPLEGLTDQQLTAGEDYFSVMRSNLQLLETALK